MIPALSYRPPVSESEDLDRILVLPRRSPLDLASARSTALVELMTERLRRRDRPVDACECQEKLGRPCVKRLLPVQAWTLFEAPLARGVVAHVAVGSGKTLLDILLPMVMPGCRVAALFVPPGLVDQLALEYQAIGEHFRVPSLIMPQGRGGRIFSDDRPVLHVMPYSRLQREEAAAWILSVKPDLIVADEAHSLKNRGATRTGRVMRYLADRIAAGEPVSLAVWSGTIAADSILNFAHLAAFALEDGSPVPIDPDEAERWAAVLDPSDWPAQPGALKRLASPGESVLEAVGRRLRETRGFITASGRDDVGASIRVVERNPGKLPEPIRAAIRSVRDTWQRPDGEELADAFQVAQCVGVLNLGFYYRWRFPGDPPKALRDEWFAARKAWGREMRLKLERPELRLDSPKLLSRAAQRFEEGYVGELPVWQSETWARWRDVKDLVPHVSEAVWVDDYLVRDAAEWATENIGIVWAEQPSFGAAVAKAARIPWHPGGDGADARIRAERGTQSIVASIGSHGEGRDGLQFAFASQLVTWPLASGKEWEQLLGRLHRRGQKADEVLTAVYRHTTEARESIDQAVRKAKFVEGLLTAEQRLLNADVEWRL